MKKRIHRVTHIILTARERSRLITLVAAALTDAEEGSTVHKQDTALLAKLQSSRLIDSLIIRRADE